MSRHDNDSDSNTDHPDQPGVASPHKDRLPVSLEKNITGKENTVIDDATVLDREKQVIARESATDLREEKVASREQVIHRREGQIISHDQKIRAAETLQAASDDHMTLLLQVNENLVIATIEAQKQAAEAQIAKDQMDYLAHHDVLTGLPNRILLQDRLNQSIEFAHRQDRQFAVLFMDLDRFKEINDSLGHAAGDQLLQSIAQRLVACVRHSDTVSRQGGDEFVLILFDIEQEEDAAFSAQKMLKSVAQPHCIEGHDLHINVSIGISIYPNDGLDAEMLIKNADTAMYHAKENGRNNYKFFEQGMNEREVRRQSIEADLRSALEQQEFVLHYQPKINLHSGAIVGIEALIRWQHPKLGLLQPTEFLSIAEDCGLILPIGRWVRHETCRQNRMWQQAGLPAVTVSVNTSALEFRDRDFLKNIHENLENSGLESRYLEIELTETVLIRDPESTGLVLHALSDLGVKIAIDNFGTGYSSLSCLTQFPIDTLKIDRSFVEQMAANANSDAIVNAVISLSKSLNKRVTAEGVETSEQFALLRALQCDEGQGYYFSHPVTVEAFTGLLQSGVSLSFPD
ncbi:MAG: EAL domain-containing protein [Methylobacter sp.]|nr:EAL domain-containing protein [Methylobacter sp.]